jgi:CheY-like chemotaxis protein
MGLFFPHPKHNPSSRSLFNTTLGITTLSDVAGKFFAEWDKFTKEQKYATIELAIKEKPDLILLDLILPKVHGLEVLKQLKENPLSFINF